VSAVRAGAAVRVLIAEPDAPTRVGIRMALEEAGFAICGEPLDARSTIEQAVRERSDVCLIDEGLRGGAIAAVDAIYRRLPDMKLIILTESEEPRSLLPAVRAGAVGFVRKDLDPTRLPATIRGVVAGEAALSRRLTFHLLENLRTRERGRSAPTKPGGPSVTDRELEVLELMTEGLRTSEIAGQLSISEVTVRRHVSSAVAKLGVADRDAAISVLSGRSRV
jgi:DNA-binding NarL/FixJ family response regulator